MSCRQSRARAAVVVLVLASASLAQAQTLSEPDDARVRLGALLLAPTIDITNVGHDSNVYNDPEHPRSDVTATISPAVDGWLRASRVQVSGRSEVDAIYYRDLSDLRAVDSVHSARLDVRLSRLMPYATGSRATTRHRRNLEIDAPVERLEAAVGGGLDVQLTGKTVIGVGASRSRVEYEGDTLYLGSDLATVLNRTSTWETLSVRYAVTPLTTAGVNVEWGQDRFESAPTRDSNSVRIGPFVEFKPLALVSGRAQVGFRRRTFLDRSTSQFAGMVARADLHYTLLGRTQFGVQVDRDLSYSYRLDNEEYLLNGLSGSVTQQLAEPWSLSASAGRYHLDYRGAVAESETVNLYGIGLGYRIGGTLLGVRLDYQQRNSDVSPGRDYDRTRISSSVTHVF